VLVCLSGLAISQASANLIVNGDFQSGNTGFSSDYTPNEIGTTENTYSIVNDPLGPAPIQNPFASEYGGIDYYDHTLGTAAGLMMAVNGGVGDSNKLVWGQTVSGLTVGQQYEFSLWLSSWDTLSPATVDVQIDNVNQATFTAPAAAGVWVNHSFLWTASSTSAGFTAIYDTNTELLGNDFALDDISLVAVPEPKTIGVFLVLPFGAGTMLILRQRRKAQ
jgi:hypothetical protein